MGHRNTNLNPRQKRFVDEYMRLRNATQAAINAGYSAKCAHVIGPRQLANVRIAAAIAEAEAELSRKAGVEAERVIRELAVIAFSDPTAYSHDANGCVVVREGSGPGAIGAVSSVRRKIRTVFGNGTEGATIEDVEVKLWNKVEALKLLGKHLGMFKKQIEVSGANGTPIQIVEVVRPSPKEEGPPDA